MDAKKSSVLRIFEATPQTVHRKVKNGKYID